MRSLWTLFFRYLDVCVVSGIKGQRKTPDNIQNYLCCGYKTWYITAGQRPCEAGKWGPICRVSECPSPAINSNLLYDKNEAQRHIGACKPVIDQTMAEAELVLEVWARGVCCLFVWVCMCEKEAELLPVTENIRDFSLTLITRIHSLRMTRLREEDGCMWGFMRFSTYHCDISIAAITLEVSSLRYDSCQVCHHRTRWNSKVHILRQGGCYVCDDHDWDWKSLLVVGFSDTS